MKWFAIAAAGVVALCAGAMVFIYRITEPGPGASRRLPIAAPAPVAEAPPEVYVPPPLPPPEPSGYALVPKVLGQPEAPFDVESLTPTPPLENAPAPVAAAPPPGLPSDPAALEDAVLAERRRRFGSQMEMLNRRGAARAGLPTPPPAPQAPSGARGPANSRRAAALDQGQN